MSDTLPPPTPPVLTVEELQTALAEAQEENRKLRAEVDGVREIMLNVYRNTKGTLDSIPLTDAQIDSLISSLMRKASVK